MESEALGACLAAQFLPSVLHDDVMAPSSPADAFTPPRSFGDMLGEWSSSKKTQRNSEPPLSLSNDFIWRITSGGSSGAVAAAPPATSHSAPGFLPSGLLDEVESPMATPRATTPVAACGTTPTGPLDVSGSMNALAEPFVPYYGNPGEDGSPAAVYTTQPQLEDLRGFIAAWSRDQEGSRMVQRMIEAGMSEQDLELLLHEILPFSVDLVSDVFGNYVIQRLLDVMPAQYRKVFLHSLEGHFPQLALQTYGCRVLQKVVDVGDDEDRQLVCTALDGHVARCVQDQNANHVIQKCIECAPDHVEFVVEAFYGKIRELATHAYGCRVLQRLLEHSVQRTGDMLIAEVIECVEELVLDQYGNYVVQFLIVNAQPIERQRVILRLLPRMLDLSKHKYASNVAEKMIQHSDDLDVIVQHVITYVPEERASVLVAMMKDQFANYVVQKLLDCVTAPQRRTLVQHIRPHVATLRKFTYGKHIVARLEKSGAVGFASPSPGGSSAGGSPVPPSSPLVDRRTPTRHQNHHNHGHHGHGGRRGGQQQQQQQ
eukprot:PhM_4_TR7176/c0_g1_i1/m.27784/K17943/PUM; pumilio RNA-binding family